MRPRTLLIAVGVCALAACEQGAQKTEEAGETPQLEAPAPTADPARGFTASNDAARTATGDLQVSIATRMPDAVEADRGATPTDVLTLRGGNGLLVEATISGSTTPATSLSGQTLRAQMGLPVEASQILVYAVTSETKPESGQGLCGADATSHVLVWEPATPGADAYKAMGVMGGAPGTAGARACPALEYTRQ